MFRASDGVLCLITGNQKRFEKWKRRQRETRLKYARDIVTGQEAEDSVNPQN